MAEVGSFALVLKPVTLPSAEPVLHGTRVKPRSPPGALLSPSPQLPAHRHSAWLFLLCRVVIVTDGQEGAEGAGAEPFPASCSDLARSCSVTAGKWAPGGSMTLFRGRQFACTVCVRVCGLHHSQAHPAPRCPSPWRLLIHLCCCNSVISRRLYKGIGHTAF